MATLNDLFAGWRLAGVLVLVAGAGASGMAASVNSKIAHHETQTDSVIVELRAQRRILEEQLCLMVGVEPKLACLVQK